jgi:tetraacyldisaccharide 4'-kinase
MLMQKTMVKIWKGEAQTARTLLGPLLFAVSRFYGAAMRVRDWLYCKGFITIARLPIPVIGVGNLSLGGTGKTAIVQLLAARLKKEGFKPGVILRGYKKKRRGTFRVDTTKDDARSAGDEAIMLARRTALPVIVGKDRAQGILLGVRDSGLNVAILDDAFQVRKIRKDVEVLVVNGREPPEALRLFPLGILREPLEMARKADIILVNKGELAQPIASLVAGKSVFHVRYRPLHLYSIRRKATVDYRYVRGRKILAFSGLGDNTSFFDLLTAIGADLVKTIEFPDHYAYRPKDVEQLRSIGGVEAVVTTEKDGVKIDRLGVSNDFFYLSIEVQIENEDDMIDLILKKARRGDARKGFDL